MHLPKKHTSRSRAPASHIPRFPLRPGAGACTGAPARLLPGQAASSQSFLASRLVHKGRGKGPVPEAPPRRDGPW